MRELSLHASALNDAEYDLYTSSLADLASLDDPNSASQDAKRDDAFYEKLTVGVREARAWLRGRYPRVPVADIDQILKLICPTMGPGDTLSGGQFFVALRLVIHTETGRDVDRALAFVQAHPVSAPPPASPPKRQLPIPPTVSHTQPIQTGQSPAESTPPILSSSNPFTAYSTHGAMEVQPHLQTQSPFNPFVSRQTTHSAVAHSLASSSSPHKLPPLPPRKPALMTGQPSILQTPHFGPPPRHASQLPSHASTSPSKPLSMDHGPTSKPLHVTSPLMRQSLQASKVGQTMKKAEEQLEKERVLQVLKSSSPSAPRNRSLSPNKLPPPPPPRPPSSSASSSDPHVPPLPRRRVRTQRSVSPPLSASSLEQLTMAKSNSMLKAFAELELNTDVGEGSYTSPFRSPDKPTPDTVGLCRSSSPSPTRTSSDLPPPKHPRRKPAPPFQAESTTPKDPLFIDTSPGHPLPPLPSSLSKNDSPTSRVFRSKSVHYHTPSPPPIPPPLRRRRPESVQVLGSPAGLLGEVETSPGPRTADMGAPLSRHVSMSATTPSPKGYHRPMSTSTPSFYSSHMSTSTSTPVTHFAADRDSPSVSNLQRTLAHLQPKFEALHPRLEKVRYKAEAGFSRRGFVRDPYGREGEDEKGLMGGEGNRGELNDDDSWERVGMDSGDDEGGVERGRSRGREANLEQDNLKWPTGEGWKPL